MRILYLHQHYSAPSGTTATRSHAFASALAARGHRVTVACGRYEGAVTGLEGRFRNARREGMSRGFRVVEFDIPYGNARGFGGRGLAFVRYAGHAGRLALTEDWDLVIASSTPLTVTLPALLAHRLRGTRFIYEIRDPWPELPRAMGASAWALAGMERMANAACRRATAVVALSEGMAETARARGTPEERLHVVPNGCDLDLFGPQVAPWRPAEAAPWDVLAVYAGTHGRANGLDQLLDAAALLLQQGERRVRLVLVGEGSEKSRLEAAAGERGLYNIIFMPPQPKRKLAALLAGCQVGVHCLAPVPEFAEWTSPNKLMDYLAAGLPVVTNQPGRAARLLAEGPSGIATPPGDAAALADALTWMAAHPGQRTAMGRAARDQAVRRWDRRLQANRFIDIVENTAEPALLHRFAPA